MRKHSPQEVTDLLQAWSQGDDRALEKLTSLVYQELRRRAHRYMQGERAGHTLQTTALVNETFLRLVRSRQVRWQDRAHFFAICAQLMRRILVDFARRHRKGGKSQPRGVSWHENNEGIEVSQERGEDLVVLDEALSKLADFDKRKSKIVELRFFGGLSVEETAEVLKISVRTVMRDWRLARAWLRNDFIGGVSDEA